MMHVGLVSVLVSIPKDVGVPYMAIVIEARGLRAADASRQWDVVFLDFFAESRHLVVDTVVTTVSRTTIIKHAATLPI
jgi:hypothetical protein